jgi:exodeoxyribonuclease VII large subunit
VPVISAVGHEADVTIADFVADVRAATPTMAAEIAVPAREEVAERLRALERAAGARLRARVEIARRRVATLSKSYALGQVRGRLEHAMQRLDHAGHRSARALGATLAQRAAKLDALWGRLSGLNPRDVLRRGYAVCVNPADGSAVASRPAAIEAASIHIVFHDGSVRAEVEGAAATESLPGRSPWPTNP